MDLQGAVSVSDLRQLTLRKTNKQRPRHKIFPIRSPVLFEIVEFRSKKLHREKFQGCLDEIKAPEVLQPQ